MRQKKKIVIVGNCQARPYAQIFTSLSDNVEILGVCVVHLANDKDESVYAALFNEADIIVSQIIAPTYPCKFVRTCDLEEKYRSKLIKIVNLYAQLYDLDWLYYRDTDRKTVPGPMGDYHNKYILEGWLSGKDKQSVVNEIANQDYLSVENESVMKNSLVTLSKREACADVKICDFICDNYKLQRLFHTFNHPTSELLVKYSERILTFADIEINKVIGDIGEPLGRWVPNNNFIEQAVKHMGDDEEISEKLDIVYRPQKQYYDDVMLVDAFYRLYNISPRISKGVTVIPHSLIQFWHESPVPSKLGAVCETWRKDNPNYKYKMYNAVEAMVFIKENFGNEMCQVFDSIAIPAMQSDFFRIIYLYCMGGVYANCALESLKSLDELLGGGSAVFVRKWNDKVWNGFIAVTPKHPIMYKLLRQLLENMHTKCVTNVWKQTGTGLFDQIVTKYVDETEEHGVSIIKQGDVSDYFIIRNDLITQGRNHWSEMQKNV